MTAQKKTPHDDAERDDERDHAHSDPKGPEGPKGEPGYGKGHAPGHSHAHPAPVPAAKEYVKAEEALEDAKDEASESANKLTALQERLTHLAEALTGSLTDDRPMRAFLVDHRILIVDRTSGVRVVEAE